MGLFQSSQYALGGIANAVLGPVTELLGGDPKRVVANCVIAMIVSYATIGALFLDATNDVPDIDRSRAYGYVALSLFVSIFKYSLGVTVTANTSKIVSTRDRGTLLGIEHALFSLCYAIGPPVGFAVYGTSGVDALAFACTGLFAASLTCWTLFGPRRAVGRTKATKGA